MTGHINANKGKETWDSEIVILRSLSLRAFFAMLNLKSTSFLCMLFSCTLYGFHNKTCKEHMT